MAVCPRKFHTEFKQNIYFRLLVLTLNCFSHAVACKSRHLLYRGTSSANLHWKRSTPNLSASPAKRLLSTGHSSESDAPKFFWGKKNKWWLLGARSGLYWKWSKISQKNCMGNARVWAAAQVCANAVLSLNNRHHFLTFPSFIATSLYTSTTCL